MITAKRAVRKQTEKYLTRPSIEMLQEIEEESEPISNPESKVNYGNGDRGAK